MEKSATAEADPSRNNLCNMEKINSTLVAVVPDIIGLFIFALVAYLSYLSFIWTTSPFLLLFFLASLLAVILIRSMILISRIIFSPTILQFRILPLHCGTATTLHRLIIWSAGYMIVVMMFIVITHKLGAEQTTLNILRLFFASIILFVAAGTVIFFRENIKHQILLSSDGEPTWGRRKFADVWHFLALLYIFLLWILIISSIDDPPDAVSRGAFFYSFFIVPIWLLLDRVVQWIVEYSLISLKIYDAHPPKNLTEEEQILHQKGKEFYGKCKFAGHLFLVLVLAVWLATLWGISLPFLSKLSTVFFESAIILFISLLFWQFISSWIERKIEESLPEEEEEEIDDDEWGGAAKRGRSYTLLPMIRKFIGSVLVVMVTMTILSSMGVDIGPLLAGAGVVGLAIGFGAQKLVADMFSGFFYLLDDAFRVGEYLEAGNVSGTVENITLRNVMLRHHRGMLQIVPHSELGAITNFMRGGIVVKFNLDFPYDADIDKIRKVIKKVGQAMLQDEELGKDFIRPVKSQGVREISNSVMTIRVKFTSQPGAHFLIRREAYKRITEALQAKNIHYAHRKVIVDLPLESANKMTDSQIRAAGAAAAQQIDDNPKPSESNPDDSIL